MWCAFFTFGLLFFVAMQPGIALAGERQDLLGKWQWRGYTIEVKECNTNPSNTGLCILVIAGAKYLGMEMLRSKFEKHGNDIYAKLADPETNKIYSTRFKQNNQNSWTLSGCTEDGTCVSGKFVRVK